MEPSLAKRLMRAISSALGIAGLLLILYLPALWLWQGYRWLDSGAWVPMPAMLPFQNLKVVRTLAGASSDPVVRENAAALAYVPQLPRPQWLDRPKEWRGLHRATVWFLENAHVGLLAAALGALCLILGAALHPRRARAGDWPG